MAKVICEKMFINYHDSFCIDCEHAEIHNCKQEEVQYTCNGCNVCVPMRDLLMKSNAVINYVINNKIAEL